MNERIKALMGKTLDSEFSHTWDTISYEGLLQFSDKFAELIVRECAKSADEWYQNHNDIHWDPAQHIKNHFGVE